MPDITMCSGDGCPLKNQCWRYKAAPSERQSFFTSPPIDTKTGKCEQFWQVDLTPEESKNLLLEAVDQLKEFFPDIQASSISNDRKYREWRLSCNISRRPTFKLWINKDGSGGVRVGSLGGFCRPDQAVRILKILMEE